MLQRKLQHGLGLGQGLGQEAQEGGEMTATEVRVRVPEVEAGEEPPDPELGVQVKIIQTEVTATVTMAATVTGTMAATVTATVTGTMAATVTATVTGTMAATVTATVTGTMAVTVESRKYTKIWHGNAELKSLKITIYQSVHSNKAKMGL